MRGAVGSLLAGLEALLAAGLPGVEVTTRYPCQQRKLPPDRPMVWLGVERITATGSPFAPYAGEGGPEPGGPRAGRELEVTVGAEILDRHDLGSCHRVFGELCQLLLLEEARPQLRELSCKEGFFDREAGAFRLSCRGTLRALLTREEEAARPLANIIVRKKEDGI